MSIFKNIGIEAIKSIMIDIVKLFIIPLAILLLSIMFPKYEDITKDPYKILIILWQELLTGTLKYWQLLVIIFIEWIYFVYRNKLFTPDYYSKKEQQRIEKIRTKFKIITKLEYVIIGEMLIEYSISFNSKGKPVSTNHILKCVKEHEGLNIPIIMKEYYFPYDCYKCSDNDCNELTTVNYHNHINYINSYLLNEWDKFNKSSS